MLLEEVGRVISKDGSGITISSQSGHRMPPLTPQMDRLLAMTDPEEILFLDFLHKGVEKNGLDGHFFSTKVLNQEVFCGPSLVGP